MWPCGRMHLVKNQLDQICSESTILYFECQKCIFISVYYLCLILSPTGFEGNVLLGWSIRGMGKICFLLFEKSLIYSLKIYVCIFSGGALQIIVVVFQ